MNSTIMVNKSIKDLAAKKAKSDGISLSLIVRLLLKEYSSGRFDIGLIENDKTQVTKVEEVKLDEKTQLLIDKSSKKWRNKLA